MKLLTAFCLIAILTGLVSAWAQSPDSASDGSSRERGKKIFASKCAHCHDNDASKKLHDGTTLLTRLAASKDSKALLATRLKSMSEEDRRGVLAYVEGLLSQFRSAQAASPGTR